jgi:hypothetical protein
MHIPTEEIFKHMDPTLTKKERRREFYRQKQKLYAKAKGQEQLKCELERLRLIAEKKEILVGFDALKYKQKVAEERRKIGLDAS